jgi:hypothetical protein
MRVIRTNSLVAIVFAAGITGFLSTNAPQQAAGAAPAKDAPGAKGAEPIPFPNGVTDSTQSTAFVSSPKGGVQAIRLEDGKVLWTNDDGQAEPWLVAGERLIARGERIFILDAKDGKRLRQADVVPYPKVEVPEKCLVSFHLWNPRASGDTLEAKWYAGANIDRSKGRPFAFEAWTKFNKSAPAGKVKVNLDSGKVELTPDPKPTDLTMELIPEGAKAGRQPADLPEALAVVWKEYQKDQNGRITLLDGRLVGVSMKLEQVGQEYTKTIFLNTWDIKTGTAAAPVELIKGKALDIANVAVTADHRHAAVQFGTSALTIYSLTTGKVVAKDVKGVPSPESAFVDGKRLYYVAQTGTAGAQALKAIDLESGKAVWDRAVKPRSTVPLPP